MKILGKPGLTCDEDLEGRGLTFRGLFMISFLLLRLRSDTIIVGHIVFVTYLVTYLLICCVSQTCHHCVYLFFIVTELLLLITTCIS